MLDDVSRIDNKTIGQDQRAKQRDERQKAVKGDACRHQTEIIFECLCIGAFRIARHPRSRIVSG